MVFIAPAYVLLGTLTMHVFVAAHTADQFWTVSESMRRGLTRGSDTTDCGKCGCLNNNCCATYSKSVLVLASVATYVLRTIYFVLACSLLGLTKGAGGDTTMMGALMIV